MQKVCKPTLISGEPIKLHNLVVRPCGIYKKKKIVDNLSKRKIPDFLIKLSSVHSWGNIFFSIKARLLLTVRPTPQTHDQALGHPIIHLR